MQPYYDRDSDDEFSDSNSIEGLNYRPQTAPPSPITELEEFKRQREFFILEKAQHYQNLLIQRDFHKYDLDNPEGQRNCKKYLKTLEEMCIVFIAKLKIYLKFFYIFICLFIPEINQFLNQFFIAKIIFNFYFEIFLFNLIAMNILIFLVLQLLILSLQTLQDIICFMLLAI